VLEPSAGTTQLGFFYADSGAVGQWDVHIRFNGQESVWADGRLLALSDSATATQRFPADSLLLAEGWHQVQVYQRGVRPTSLQLVFVPKNRPAGPIPASIIAPPAPRATVVTKALPPAPSRTDLLPLLLIPILVLALWRFTDADTLDRILSFKTGYSRLLEQAAQGNLLRGISALWALLLRLVLLGSTAAILVFFWIATHTAQQVPVFLGLRFWQLLLEVASHPLLLFVLWVGIAVVYVVGRYLLLAIITTGFGVRGFVRGFAATETVASLPGLLVVFLCAFGALQLPASYQSSFDAILLLVVVVYLLFRYALVLLGLTRHLRLPWVGVVLYICVLEILPWLLLFV
jgi:hypothetical protein